MGAECPSGLPKMQNILCKTQSFPVRNEESLEIPLDVQIFSVTLSAGND